MELRILEKLDNILQLLQNKIPKDNYMDIKQVAEYSSLSRSSIRRSCQEGRLKYSDKHGKFLFLKSDVELWINNG
jgi:predicted DNA-binding transcriptional regulator AlpA